MQPQSQEPSSGSNRNMPEIPPYFKNCQLLGYEQIELYFSYSKDMIFLNMCISTCMNSHK